MGGNKRYPIERFAARRQLADFDFIHDGHQIAYVVNTSGQQNVWVQALNSDGSSSPSQLTVFEEASVRNIHCSPSSPEIVFTADHEGREDYGLYRLHLEDPWPEPLGNLPPARNELGLEGYSPDGRFIAYSATIAPSEDLLPCLYDLSRGVQVPLATGSGVFYTLYWRPDSRALTILQAASELDWSILLASVDSGEVQTLSPSIGGDTRFIAGPWSTDAKGFYVLSDLDRQVMNLAYFDVRTREMHWVVESSGT